MERIPTMLQEASVVRLKYKYKKTSESFLERLCCLESFYLLQFSIKGSGYVIFSKVFEEEPNSTHCTNTIFREAVRAIILNQNKVLLVHSNKGDYKFPGGGLEDNETHLQGLVREVREETGYVNCYVYNKLGLIYEKKVDDDDDNTLFQMTSHYYLCELNGTRMIAQQLEAYESELQFTPKWVLIDEAIKQNENLGNTLENNRWLQRETFVLKRAEKIRSVRIS